MPADSNEVIKWYTRCVEDNNPTGQYNLGSCFRNGIGMIKNDWMVSKWVLKSAKLENKIENNGMRLDDRFEESIMKIKNSVNKGAGNESSDIFNQWLRYLLIDWPLTSIFDPGGNIRFILKGSWTTRELQIKNYPI
ncbi:4582_t:CDS:1 [Ambispora leptoticha]|uniref:4582_t:CDS:1 n=1 Tax=Ambispora leptoticha TaxID=144679 RepID=A0A9N8Z6Y8_9GLOM|nr:4582_t:CDS:1 [Ambispora leptoticha]